MGKIAIRFQVEQHEEHIRTADIEEKCVDLLTLRCMMCITIST